MDNTLVSSNSALLIRKLRKRKLMTKGHIFDKSPFDNSKTKTCTNHLEKSFNFKTNNTPKIIFPSLSSTKVKYFTKSNSRASSSKDEIKNEKDNTHLIKTKYNDKNKITLKLPDKFETFKKVKSHLIKPGNNYFKTENNQRIIFNNIGINYNKLKYNNNNNTMKKSLEKKDLKTTKEINKLNNNIKVLLIKNNKLQSEKSEKENKIEILEQKIDKLINFIKNNETLNLKNKINSQENDIQFLQKENEQLKKELENKNEIISSLTQKNKQINENDNNINYYKQTNKENGKKANNNNIDIEKLKNISIDPDDI